MQQIHRQPPSGKVVLAGEGDLADKGLALFLRHPEHMGRMYVAAVVRPGGARPAGLPSGVEVYADCASAFAAHPDAELACDISGEGRFMEELRTHAPLMTSVLQASAGDVWMDTLSGKLAGEFAVEAMNATRAMLNALIDQFEDEVMVVDLDGRIVNLNAQLLDAWGGVKDDYIGLTCADLGKWEMSCAKSQRFVQAVMSTGQKLRETYTEMAPDGTVRYFRVSAFPLLDEEGEISLVAFARRETTERVHIEQRLFQSQKLAAIGELSTYVAHEIRNPLFAIGGFANALIRTPELAESAREKARIILEESQRLDEILKSIINFARPTGQELGAVDCNEVVRQTVEIMSMGSEGRVPIVLELGDPLPKIHGNAEMLKQCLINLIKNAQEAMDKGTITVRTRLEREMVHLEVQDDGPGIPVAIQDQIFSPFFSTKDKGSGLGLAMTRKIINEIGGKLTLESEPGQGTTVTMALGPMLAMPNQTGDDG